MVRAAGFTVVEASNADLALELLESSSDIAAVFTDMHIPGSMDGLRLVAIVRDRWPPNWLLAHLDFGLGCELYLALPRRSSCNVHNAPRCASSTNCHSTFARSASAETEAEAPFRDAGLT